MSQHTKQQVLSAFHFRSAIRRYDPNKKVSEEDFHYILELGRYRQVPLDQNRGIFW